MTDPATNPFKRKRLSAERRKRQAKQAADVEAGWRFWADVPPPDASMVIEIRRGRLSEPFRTTAARLGPYFNIASIEWRPAIDPAMTKPNPHAHEVFALARACQTKLSPHKPEVQGGALATLLAAWVCSCSVENDAKATRKVREDILRDHFDHVKHLVEVVENETKETLQ